MILLDTHAILWWQAGGSRLSKAALREIERAESLMVSPISFWEISILVEKGRIEIDRDTFVWVNDFLAGERIEVAHLTPEAAAGAGRLASEGFGGDPADALLYATARELLVPLVTKDRAIRSYARKARDVKALW